MRGSLLLAALAALVLLFGGSPPRLAQEPELLTTRAAGSFTLSNSLDGSAIFDADNIGPGDAAAGSVTIANTGTLRTAVRLAQDTVADVPGPGGGVLSGRLDLHVRDVTEPSAPVALYAGKLAAMPELTAGVLDPGESRNYEFSVSLAHGTDDNAYEGSTLSARYLWGAHGPPPAGGEPDPGNQAGGGPPTAETPPRDPPPRLRLRVPRNQRVVKRRRLVAYMRCNEACRLQASARFPAAGRRPKPTRRLRRGRVAAHKRVRLAFRVPRVSVRSMRRALRLHRRTTVLLTVTARDDGGNATTIKRRVPLRGSHRTRPGVDAPPRRTRSGAQRASR